MDYEAHQQTQTGVEDLGVGSGLIEAIYVTSGAGSRMRPLSEAEAVAGEGLAGDRYLTGKGYYSNKPLPGGGRQLTLIESEALEVIERDTGIRLDAGESRRNLLTKGVRLNDLVGRRFHIGEALCEGIRLCDPCKYLEEVTGKPVLKPLVNRGGLRASILSGGRVRLGDRLVPAAAQTPAARSG